MQTESYHRNITICPKCGHQQPEGFSDCMKCGIVFTKFRKKELDKESVRKEYQQRPKYLRTTLRWSLRAAIGTIPLTILGPFLPTVLSKLIFTIVFWPANLVLLIVGTPYLGVAPDSYSLEFAILGLKYMAAIPLNGIGWGFFGFSKVLAGDVMRSGLRTHWGKVTTVAILVGITLVAVAFRPDPPTGKSYNSYAEVAMALRSGHHSGKSPNSYAESDLRNAVTAQEAYYADNMEYCSSMEQLTGEVGGAVLSKGVTIHMIYENKQNYKMVAVHEMGNAAFIVEAPGRSIDRVMAKDFVGELKTKAERLIHDLKSEDSEIRGDAAVGLFQLNDSRTLVFIDILKSGDPKARERAAEELKRRKDVHSVEHLIDALTDEDWNIRRSAADILGSMWDKRAVEPLILVLQNDEDKRVRHKAAESLGKMREARAVGPLLEALNDEDIDVQNAAAKALGPFVSKDPRALDALLTAMKDRNPRVRGTAVRGLEYNRNRRLVEPMIVALKDEVMGIRRSAAWALGRLGDARVVEPLIDALVDEDYEVRMAAARALGEIGDTRARALLNDSLCCDENEHVQHAAKQALRRIESLEARRRGRW